MSIAQRVGVEESETKVDGSDRSHEHLRKLANQAASGEVAVSEQKEGWDDISPDDPGGFLGDK